MNVVIVVSAGNKLRNACRFYPSSSKYVITVGAINNNIKNYNIKSLYSNYGRCVDIFAPGNFIKSSSYETDISIQTATGTSISAPFVTGVVALYLQRDPTMTPADVLKSLQNDGQKPVLLKGLFSPNMVLNTKALING